MIDFRISGFLEKDSMVFSLNGEEKTISQTCQSVQFFLEENKTHRVYFEQRTEQLIPHQVEVVLNILFLPVRGVFNAILFNADQNWEREISAFKLSGYIDVNPTENAEVSFKVKQGYFEKNAGGFYKPTITFSPGVLVEQTVATDAKEITKKHNNHLLNIASVGVLLLALFVVLLFAAAENLGFTEVTLVLTIMLALVGVGVFLVLHSFKRKKQLLALLKKHEQNK